MPKPANLGDILFFVTAGGCLLMNSLIEIMNINSEKNTARNVVLIIGIKNEIEIAPTIINGTIALTQDQSILWFL